MMKFTLASRHMDEGTRERFFYEWSMIHVALMLTTPTVPRVFRRYAQHFNIAAAAGDQLIYPLSPENWESFAEHWVENYEAFLESVSAQDYVLRMQPHRFGSHRFITALSSFSTVYEAPGFCSGGVKLIHFLKKEAAVSQDAFTAWMRTDRAATLQNTLGSKGFVRKIVHDTPAPIDPAVFKGTLFEMGSIGLYAGMEEIWLEDVNALGMLSRDRDVRAALAAGEKGMVNAPESISMLVCERLLWDFVTPGEQTPQPAILNPESLEALIDRQGYRDFDKPEKWARQKTQAG